MSLNAVTINTESLQKENSIILLDLKPLSKTVSIKKRKDEIL